jgi:hypothetical protein
MRPAELPFSYKTMLLQVPAKAVDESKRLPRAARPHILFFIGFPPIKFHLEKAVRSPLKGPKKVRGERYIKSSPWKGIALEN